MFIAALYIKAKKWKQFKYSLEQNVVYIHKVEYYFTKTMNEILIHAIALKTFSGWTLKTFSEVKEARHKRPHIVWSHLYEMSKTSKSIEKEGKWVVAKGTGEGWGRRA